MCIYVELKDCERRLFQLAIEFDIAQKTPRYETHSSGVTKLCGILASVKESWYPSRIQKAAYLFVSINKGHLFLNGNKRISLLVTLDFLYKNGFRRHRPLTKEAYLHWFKNEFPNYRMEGGNFRKVYGWAFYNLSKAVASEIPADFDQLKLKTEQFIQFSFKSAQKKLGAEGI